MKRVVFLRHTQTAFNVPPIRLRGGLDVPLSPEGFTQIADVTKQFRAAYPDVKAVHSSTLARANILATTIAHEYGLSVEPSDDLRSWDYGVLNGRPVSDVMNVLTMLSSGAGRDLSPEGGESMHRFLARLTAKIKDIIQSAPEQGVVVIVTHLQNIMLGVHWLRLGLPDDLVGMPYEYTESNEIPPGTWVELRREWVCSS